VFESSHPFLLFDYFRVPYVVDSSVESATRGFAQLFGPGADPRRFLTWPRWGEMSRTRDRALVHVKLGDDATVVGQIMDDSEAMDRLGRGWEPTDALRVQDGTAVAHIWRSRDGGTFLPFDPDEAIRNLWSEAYQTDTRSATRALRQSAMRAYYRARPAMPRALQIRLRRMFSRLQARTSFPRWPLETGLHDLYDRLFEEAVRVARAPVPRIAAWPSGRRWALVLTHDVETATGYANIGMLREMEERNRYRSSWNLVPRRYDIDDEDVRVLLDRGHEVGVHGLYHDGRDLESERLLRERLPEIRAYADRWQAVGFRSPATHRSWDLMPLLGFEYDSSYPDTDPYEPESGGCCSWLPFMNDDLVELPITLPQDHTIFVVLRRASSVWLEKAERIRERGGMALLITHPDYMLGQARLKAYGDFLEAFRDDPTAWRALPRDVNTWWRRRAVSAIEPGNGEWKVVGPTAGDAVVELVEPRTPQAVYL
jgi:peptidoglycan/xylan/chitin deacetylase (PgdA/CDA1 family)